MAATVAVVVVAVVTSLYSVLDVSVATGGGPAIVQASIGLDLVAVFTIFDARMNVSITA